MNHLIGFIDEIEKNAGFWSWLKGLFGHKPKKEKAFPKMPSKYKIRKTKMAYDITDDIMRAGKENKRLQFTYNQKQRDVEPYSFRKAKDGSIRFYGYDRNSSSIKQFKLPDITNLKVSEETFTPKWPIEF